MSQKKKIEFQENNKQFPLYIKLKIIYFLSPAPVDNQEMDNAGPASIPTQTSKLFNGNFSKQIKN